PNTLEPSYSMASQTTRDMNDSLDQRPARVNDANVRVLERPRFTHRPNEPMRSMTIPRPYPITSRIMQDTIRAGIHDGVPLPINVRGYQNVARTFTSPPASFPPPSSQIPSTSSGLSRVPTAFPPSSEALYIPSGPARSLRPPQRSEPPYQPTNAGETLHSTSLRQAPANTPPQVLTTSTHTNSDLFTPAI